MEISLESYELYNEIFLAESELFASITSIGADIVNESVGLISIHEDTKETINKYLTKITDAIQKAWEKFKEIVMNGADDVWLKANQKKILTGNPTFTINNYPKYDMNKLSSIKLIPINYDEMKESLQSNEAFIEKYYSELAGEGSISEKIEKLILKSRSDERCTPDILKECYNFCATDVKAEISKIEADLKIVNDSNKNIERIINSITSDQSTQEAVELYNYFLNEADQEKSEKMSFTDDKNGPNADSGSTLVKDIHVYISASTDILSAKMKIVKDIKKEYMNILKHFVGGGKSNKEEDNKENTEKGNRIKI